MTTKSRKTRNDTVAGLVKAAQPREVGNTQVPVGVELDDDELMIFQSHWHTRESWTPSEQHMLAHLAQAESSMNRQKREIKEEGEIVLLSNGMECANPRFKIMGQNERLFTQLVAKLGLSAESRSAGQRNAISTGSAMVKPTAKTGKVNWQAEAKKIK